LLGKEASQMMEERGFVNVNKVVIGLNECMVDVIRTNNIVDETKQFMNFLTGNEWFELIEEGTRQE